MKGLSKIIGFASKSAPIVGAVCAVANLSLAVFLGFKEKKAKENYRQEKLRILQSGIDQNLADALDEEDALNDE